MVSFGDGGSLVRSLRLPYVECFPPFLVDLSRSFHLLWVQRQPDSADAALVLLAVVLLPAADGGVHGPVTAPVISVVILLAFARDAEQEHRPAVPARRTHKRSQANHSAWRDIGRGQGNDREVVAAAREFRPGLGGRGDRLRRWHWLGRWLRLGLGLGARRRRGPGDRCGDRDRCGFGDRRRGGGRCKARVGRPCWFYLGGSGRPAQADWRIATQGSVLS